MLNLEAKTNEEKRVLEFLENNASETLIDSINNGQPYDKNGLSLLNKKTLSGFMRYACGEARKTVESGSSCACIDDATVFGWAIHYFEESSIVGDLYNLDGTKYEEPKPQPKPKNTSKPVNKDTTTLENKPTEAVKDEPKEEQLSLFDLLN